MRARTQFASQYAKRSKVGLWLRRMPRVGSPFKYLKTCGAACKCGSLRCCTDSNVGQRNIWLGMCQKIELPNEPSISARFL